MTQPLRIVFAGTPEFAAEHLKALLTGRHRVIAVYTQPDRPAGRGQKLTPSPVKQLALQHDIPVLQPLTLRDPAAQAELAALEPRAFVEHVLVRLGVVTVMVGNDFRFGRGGVGDPVLLQRLGEEYGFDVDVVGDVQGGGRRVSSSWVRDLLAAGDVEGAARLLGRAHTVTGEVVHGLKRGRELGFPTANLRADAEGFIPADGIYAGWLVDLGGPDDASSVTTRYPAAISVGTNPTFDDVPLRQVEAYVLDETTLDLYGHRVQIQFTHRIRGMVAFEGIDALIAQMTDDVARVRAALT